MNVDSFLALKFTYSYISTGVVLLEILREGHIFTAPSGIGI